MCFVYVCCYVDVRVCMISDVYRCVCMIAVVYLWLCVFVFAYVCLVMMSEIYAWPIYG